MNTRSFFVYGAWQPTQPASFTSSVTGLPSLLESLGLLVRRRATADERQVIVSLTAAGRALRKKGQQRTLVAATGLERDELAKLQRAMVKVRDNLIAHASRSEGEPGSK